jgi:hypothetical protein
MPSARADWSSADFNGDNDVDFNDWANLMGCFNGSRNPSPCSGDTKGDLDGDYDVDFVDYAELQRQYDGEGRPARTGLTPLGTVRWYFADPQSREVRTFHAGDVLHWSIAVEVSEDTRGLALGDFDLQLVRVSGGAPVGFGDYLRWVPSFDVLRRGAPFGVVGYGADSNGPGMMVSYTGTWLSPWDRLFGVGCSHAPGWVGPAGTYGAAWGVGLASRRSALLAEPDKGYVLFEYFEYFFRQEPLGPGCYRLVLLPSSANVQAPGFDYSVAFDRGHAVPAAAVTGDSFVFCYEQPWRSPIGDTDADGDVDGADFGIFAGCFNGTGNTVGEACAVADLNSDNSVDGVDYGIFASCFNGTGNPPACG